MKHLKTYKIFESEVITDNKEIISDIKNCFLSVSDMIEDSVNFGVRITEFSKKRGKVIRDLNIKGVDFEVMIIPEMMPMDYSQKTSLSYISSIDRSDMSRIYRPTNINNDMITEIENSISLTEGTVDLNLDFAVVEWLNAYNYDKGENGPGAENKRFSKDGIVPVSDKIEKGSYNLSYLCDFLKSKGDKVRWVKLFFAK